MRLHKKTPALETIDVDILQHQLASIPKKMKRNKVFCKSMGGLKIASADGTETYRKMIHCDECLYHIKTKDGTGQIMSIR